MVNLMQTVFYPFANKNNILNYLILSLINVGWFLLIPMFIVNGYLVKVIRNTIQGNENLPDWTLNLSDWWYMLKHGFFFTLILFVYMIVPLMLAFLGTSGISPGDAAMGTVPVISRLSWTLMAASLITLLLAVIFIPMALVFYAGSESIVQAFNIPEMLAVIAQKWLSYLLVFALGTLILFVALLIGGFLYVFMGLVMIYPWIFMMHAVARIFRETQ